MESISEKYGILRKFVNSRGDSVYSLKRDFAKDLISKFDIKSGRKDRVRIGRNASNRSGY